MDEIIEIYKLKVIFPYLDNVMVGEMNHEEHDANVSAFLDVLKLSDSKTVSSVSDISILGYRVGNGAIRPDPERLQP